MMQGLDLDLNFLDDFVESEARNGKPTYQKERSMTIANIGSAIPVGRLNFQAYKQEQPSYPTIIKPEGTVDSVGINKESVAGNPVFNQNTTANVDNSSIKLNNVKSVWG